MVWKLTRSRKKRQGEETPHLTGEKKERSFESRWPELSQTQRLPNLRSLSQEPTYLYVNTHEAAQGSKKT